MSKPPFPLILPSSRRKFLRTSLLGLGALAPFAGALCLPAHAATGRNTDKVRLTWGHGLLPGFAKARGEFEKVLAKDGIKVEWLGPFINHAPTIQAVVGGSADFSFGGSTAVALAAIAAGSPLVFAQFTDNQPRSTAILVKEASSINRVEDLVGKSVAVNRSGLGEFLLIAALEKHRVDRSKVKFVYLNPPDAGPAFAADKVDAWSIFGITTEIVRAEHKTRDLFLESKDLEYQIDYTSFLVTTKFSQENPDLVRAVTAGFAAEARWISQNGREAEYMLQKASNYSDAIRDKYIAQKRYFDVYSVNDKAFVATLQKSADWLQARRMLPEKVVVADHLARI